LRITFFSQQKSRTFQKTKVCKRYRSNPDHCKYCKAISPCWYETKKSEKHGSTSPNHCEHVYRYSFEAHCCIMQDIP